MDLFAFVLGIVAGLFANAITAYVLFNRSSAGHRIKLVVEATNVIKETRKQNAEKSTGQVRDRYRFAMGVPIDNIIGIQESGYNENGFWPLLVDTDNEDRWAWFEHRVRSVIDDIAPFAFLTLGLLLPNLAKSVKRLDRLLKLCYQIETVVSLLDAAMENEPVIEIASEGIRVIPDKTGDSRVKELETVYKDLYRVWRDWERVV